MMILNGLTKGFQASKETGFQLSDVSLSVPEGKTVAVLGPNGAGKSTLLKLIAGEIELDSGEMVIQDAGKDWPIPCAHSSLRSMYLDQDSGRDIVPSMTLGENLLLAEIPGKIGSLQFARRRAAKSRAKEALSKIPMGLHDRIDQQARTLSGGEKQGLVLARVLLRSNRILLLDEFVSALTSRLSFKIMSLVKDVVKDRKAYCLIASHHLDLVFQFADYLLFLHKGKILHEVVENTSSSQQEVIRLFSSCLKESIEHV